MNNMRVGFGFDIHRFTKKGKGIMLGGAFVPAPFGIKAVSDGDVVLHAVCDALCGAALLGDIGDYFPPQATHSKNIKSTVISDLILKKVRAKKLAIGNVDITLIAQKPPLFRHKPRILASLKKILKVKTVNVKVKSKEHLDILGGKDAIACLVVVTLQKC